jgi:hypothetical protein
MEGRTTVTLTTQLRVISVNRRTGTVKLAWDDATDPVPVELKAGDSYRLTMTHEMGTAKVASNGKPDWAT